MKKKSHAKFSTDYDSRDDDNNNDEDKDNEDNPLENNWMTCFGEFQITNNQHVSVLNVNKLRANVLAECQ